MSAYNPFNGRLVRLRAREPEDAAVIHGWLDVDLVRFTEARYPWSLANVRGRAGEGSEPTYAHARFAVVAIDDGRLVGDVAIHESSPENRSGWLALTFGPTERGRGYGSDAVGLLCRFGFDEMNLRRLELEVLAGNARARHVYQRAGFVEEGCRRDAYFAFGRYEDAIVMGLLRDELREVAP